MCPTDLLMLLVLWPVVNWPLLPANPHIHEACVSKLLIIKERRIAKPANTPVSLAQKVIPAGKGAVIREGAIIANSRPNDVLELASATGGLVFVGLFEKPGPVLDRASHHARIDKVKGRREGPVILDIIDVELTIGWDALNEVLVVVRELLTKSKE